MPVPITAYLCLAAAALFWGLSFPAVKLALEAFSPLVLLCVRFVGASLFFLAVFAWRGFPRLDRRTHRDLFRLSLFMPGAYFLFETYGIRHTTATKAGLIAALIPVAVLTASALFRGEAVTRRAGTGALAAMAGVTLLVLGDEAGQGLAAPALGDGLMFGAVAAACGYMLLTARLGEHCSCLTITAFQMFYGAVYMLPLAAVDLARGQGLNPAALGPEPLAAVAGLTALATVAAFFAYNHGLSLAPPARASLFINAVPVVSALGAWALLGERLGPLQLLGGAVVVAAVTWTTAAREAGPGAGVGAEAGEAEPCPQPKGWA